MFRNFHLQQRLRPLGFHFILLVGFATIWLAASAVGADGPEWETAGKQPPNFVVIMVDDLDLGSFHQLLDGGKLPRIQEHFLDVGTDVAQAFVSNSLCCPSRATFLTGQYAHNHGVQNVTGTNGGYAAFHPGGADRPTLGTWLQAAGYYTALVGKYKNGYGVGTPAPAGWSYWRAIPSHALVPGSYRFVRPDGSVELPTTYQTRAVGEQAELVINTVPAADPLFLYLAPTAPHVEWLTDWNHDGCNSNTHPNFTGYLSPDRGDFNNDGIIDGYPASDYAEYGCDGFPQGCLRQKGGDPAPGFDLPGLGKASFDSFAATPQAVQDKWEALSCGDNLQQLRRLHSERLESMLSIDVMVGRVVDALAAAGRLSNSVLVFTSDNGYFLGEHRLGNKGLAYDESVRVPLVVRPPGPRYQARTDLLVGNVDLAPTLLDYAGLPWAASSYAIDGRSLRPYLQGEPSPGPWRKNLLLEAEHPRGQNPVGPQRWWVFPDYHAVRTDPMTEAMISNLTYISYQDPIWPGGYSEEFFFDLKTDPDQVVDLLNHPSYTVFLAMMRSKVQELQDCVGQGCRTAEETWGSASD